jgi:putative addiction module component (TIGR02574 family)
MGNSTQHIFEQALRLPEKERAELAAQLLESLPPDEGYDQEWAAEIQRRVQEIREGKAELVDAGVALAQLRSKYLPK